MLILFLFKRITCGHTLNNMKKRPLIVFPDADLAEAGSYDHLFKKLENVADFKLFSGEPSSEEEFVQRIKGANGVLLGWDFPSAVMRKADNLEVISFSGIGVGKFVDMEQALERNITVCNCPGYADITVAEHTMGLLLSTTRHIGLLDRKLRSGLWDQSREGIELNGKTIGLIGFGGIARHFAKLCKAFGMTVKVWTRSMNPDYEREYGINLCALEDLLSGSDIVSLHLASNSQTRNMIDKTAFSRMRDGVIFLNTARAELVDETAMLDALKSGRISVAGVDVFHTEPLPESNPLVTMDNVIITPHIAYNTPGATHRLFEIAVENLENYFAGSPINRVTS